MGITIYILNSFYFVWVGIMSCVGKAIKGRGERAWGRSFFSLMLDGHDNAKFYLEVLVMSLDYWIVDEVGKPIKLSLHSQILS